MAEVPNISMAKKIYYNSECQPTLPDAVPLPTTTKYYFQRLTFKPKIASKHKRMCPKLRI
jgi:hypothetical protein